MTTNTRVFPRVLFSRLFLFTLICIGFSSGSRAETRVCANTPEGGTAQIACPIGEKITKINFSSYGQNGGRCGSFRSYCRAPDSVSRVSNLCLGKSSCSVRAVDASSTNDGFNDVCSGGDRLRVQVICSGDGVLPPSPTPAPTSSPVPTASPAPTATPKPTLAPTATPAPSIAPSPTPGSGGYVRKNLIFEADFEGNVFEGRKLNANGVWSTFNMSVGGQYCCNDSITKSSKSREGSSSAKMQVRVGDPSVSSGYRAELQPQVDDSGEKWYGFSLYFETPQSGGIWRGTNGVIAQWHPNNSTGSSSLALWAYGDGDVLVGTNPKGERGATIVSTSATYSANQWHDVVYHVNWSTGLVQVWWDGVKIFDKNVGAFTGQYFKFGMNRWLVDQDWVIYYDSLRIGNENATYQDVAPGN